MERYTPPVYHGKNRAELQRLERAWRTASTGRPDDSSTRNGRPYSPVDISRIRFKRRGTTAWLAVRTTTLPFTTCLCSSKRCCSIIQIGATKLQGCECTATRRTRYLLLQSIARKLFQGVGADSRMDVYVPNNDEVEHHVRRLTRWPSDNGDGQRRERTTGEVVKATRKNDGFIRNTSVVTRRPNECR